MYGFFWKLPTMFCRYFLNFVFELITLHLITKILTAYMFRMYFNGVTKTVDGFINIDRSIHISMSASIKALLHYRTMYNYYWNTPTPHAFNNN